MLSVLVVKGVCRVLQAVGDSKGGVVSSEVVHFSVRNSKDRLDIYINIQAVVTVTDRVVSFQSKRGTRGERAKD